MFVSTIERKKVVVGARGKSEYSRRCESARAPPISLLRVISSLPFNEIDEEEKKERNFLLIYASHTFRYETRRQ